MYSAWSLNQNTKFVAYQLKKCIYDFLLTTTKECRSTTSG